MNLRATRAAAGTLTLVSILAGCSTSPKDPDPSTGGTSFGGSGGSGGGVSGGAGSSGASGTGAGGRSAGGASGAGGVSVGGSAGHATGGAGGTGSSSGGSGGDAIPPTFATFKLVLTGTTPPCTGSDCHGGDVNILHMSLKDSDDVLYNTLTTHVSKNCGNIPVITPGNPQQSALVKILKGPCGDTPRMPKDCIEDEFGSNCVPNEYIAAIEQWVANGAPKQ